MTEKEIDQNLMFLFVRGSQAYGTNNDQSDEDLGGVCMPNLNVILGNEKFDQKDDYVDENGEKTDKVVYNFTKTVELLIQNNPNILDFIYAPERCIRHSTPEWERLVEIRDSFLCTKAKWAYQGYAVAQLNRIETHRKYLHKPVTKPSRAEFGLPQQSIFPNTQLESIAKISSKYVDASKQDSFYTEMEMLFDREGALVFKKYIDSSYYTIAIADFKKRQKEFLRMISSISGKFIKDEYINMAHNELRYITQYQKWQSYQKWSKYRNQKRKELEAKCGYDAKHAMHLIRLLKMSVEIMEGKGVLVDRTNIDRDHLMEIRYGNISFDDIQQEASNLNKKADELYKTSQLPDKPDLELITKVKTDLLLESIERNSV